MKESIGMHRSHNQKICIQSKTDVPKKNHSLSKINKETSIRVSFIKETREEKKMIINK